MSKHQVVVAYDFSSTADLALARAVDLASRDGDTVLHFVTVLDSHQSYQIAENVRLDLLARLQHLFASYQPGIDLEFFAHTRLGRPVDEILDLAEEIGADMIVVGSHDRGPVGRLLLGSVSEAVVRGARCPVLVARKEGYPKVELEKVVAFEGEHHKRMSPHRYSYTSAIAQVRPVDWPIS